MEQEVEDDVMSPVRNTRNDLSDRLSDTDEDQLDERDIERRNRRNEDEGRRSGL